MNGSLPLTRSSQEAGQNLFAYERACVGIEHSDPEKISEQQVRDHTVSLLDPIKKHGESPV